MFVDYHKESLLWLGSVVNQLAILEGSLTTVSTGASPADQRRTSDDKHVSVFDYNLVSTKRFFIVSTGTPIVRP